MWPRHKPELTAEGEALLWPVVMVQTTQPSSIIHTPIFMHKYPHFHILMAAKHGQTPPLGQIGCEICFPRNGRVTKRRSCRNRRKLSDAFEIKYSLINKECVCVLLSNFLLGIAVAHGARFTVNLIYMSSAFSSLRLHLWRIFIWNEKGSKSTLSCNKYSPGLGWPIKSKRAFISCCDNETPQLIFCRTKFVFSAITMRFFGVLKSFTEFCF